MGIMIFLVGRYTLRKAACRKTVGINPLVVLSIIEAKCPWEFKYIHLQRRWRKKDNYIPKTSVPNAQAILTARSQ